MTKLVKLLVIPLIISFALISSLLNKNSPKIDIPLNQIPIPILGICYGFQYISKEFGGVIEKSNHNKIG